MYDLIIIGSGAAGLAAAIYAGRYQIKTMVVGKQFGGETSIAATIGNYPGILAVDGYDLMGRMKEQAVQLGAEVVDGEVVEVKKQQHCFSVFTAESQEYQSKALLFALGTERRKLGLPNEAALTAKGVHYCVTCDGPLYSGRVIGIVGGGDASVKGANLAAQYAKKIYLITREQELRAEPVNLEQMKQLGDKVEVIYETAVQELVAREGGVGLSKIVLSKPFNQSVDLALDGLFVEVGALPNVALARSLGVELDDKGYIKVNSMMETNIDGVFAAGDVTNHFGAFKQDITAAAQGAVATTSAFKDLKIHGGEICEVHARPARNAFTKK